MPQVSPANEVGRVLPDPPSRASSEPPDRKFLILLAATGLLLAIYALPTPPPLERAGNMIPLTAAGKTCLGIMAFAVILWVTETLPFAATSLLVVLLIPAFGALIGGIATPAGTAANIVAIAQLKQFAATDVSFVRWMRLGVPASLLMVPFAWWILRWLFPPEIDRLPISVETIRARLRELGPLRRAERRTLLVFAVVVALWVLTPLLEAWSGGRIALPIEAVGLAGGVALFLPGLRVLSWKEAEAQVEWGGVMMIVAGLSLGLAVFNTGAARWLAWVLLGQITSVPDVLRPFVIVLAVAGLHMLFSSNTVTATIIIPILVALATDLHLDPWTTVAPAAFTSSLAFILVSEGPTTVIPYSSGYFSIRDMAKAGVLMTIAAALCIAATQFVARSLSLDLGAVHDAPGARVERVAAVHDAAVVPEHQVADPPLVAPRQGAGGGGL